MKRGEIGLGRRLLRRIIFVGDVVAELVGVAQVAAEQAAERIALEAVPRRSALNSWNSRSCALFSGTGAATGSARPARLVQRRRRERSRKPRARPCDGTEQRRITESLTPSADAVYQA